MRRAATSLLVAGQVVLGGLALGQAPKPKTKNAGPSIPDAVTEAPEWLKAGAPFDVAKFLAVPPDDQNAAPLYLDALLEFSAEVAPCFPPGPALDQRKKVASERGQRWRAFEWTEVKAPGSTPNKDVDALVAEYDEGFRKLELAQKRPRCVFAAGINMDSPMPHVEAARQIMPVVAVRVRRDLDRGQVARPIRDVETILRVCQDLQPRGRLTSQLAATAIENYCYGKAVLPILGAKDLKKEDCDRLLGILIMHETQSIDGFQESLKADYIQRRTSIRIALGRASERSRATPDIQRRWVEAILIGRRVEMILYEGSGAGSEPDPEQIRQFADELAKVSLSNYNAVVTLAGDTYRSLAEIEKRPFAEHEAANNGLLVAIPKDRPENRLFLMLLPVPRALSATDVANARTTAILRGTICLVALKRWSLVHRSTPADLRAATEAAGLKSVPIDPYDGKPFRMAIIDGKAVIYSIGSDLRDDGGRIDWDYGRTPGDITFRLSEMLR